MISHESGYLQIERVSRGFGGVLALDDLSLQLPEDQLTAIIGPNGAGKTTLFNTITGYVAPQSGAITYHGRQLNHLGPDRISRLGIARTFQELRLFEPLSVLDNMRVSTAMDPWPVIEQLGLEQYAMEPVQNLSYAAQKLTALGRALAMKPRLLLLDEPTSGLDHESIERMLTILDGLKEQSMGICLIEHNLDIIRRLDPRVLCLHMGRLFAEGDLQSLSNDPEVQKIFFGEEVVGATKPAADQH